MIALFGKIPANDIALIDELKKYFEADEVIINWNGEDDKTSNKTTLLITNKKPPYKTQCHFMSIEAAQQLLAA